MLDYFGKQDTLVFLDETPRSIERGMATETEFSESMKQRLEKGYLLPGQMRNFYPQGDFENLRAQMHLAGGTRP